MRVKVHGGVIGSVGERGLCVTCRYGHVREMANDLLILCARMHDGTYQRVTAPVLRCNDYEDSNTPDKWDLEQIAWTLTTDEKTKKVGFRAPNKSE